MNHYVTATIRPLIIVCYSKSLVDMVDVESDVMDSLSSNSMLFLFADVSKYRLIVSDTRSLFCLSCFESRKACFVLTLLLMIYS